VKQLPLQRRISKQRLGAREHIDVLDVVLVVLVVVLDIDGVLVIYHINNKPFLSLDHFIIGYYYKLYYKTTSFVLPRE
jgi:hypothetical protein